MDSWAGGVFESPRVSAHIAEARRFIASSDHRWDQINLNLLQTSPAAGQGRSHVDARVLTVEAIQDYLNHLQPHGVLTVIQNSTELASRTHAAILAANGNRDDSILSFQLSEPTNPFSHLLIARNEAFTNAEVERLRSIATDCDAVIATYPSLANPATDDRPFIFEPSKRIAIHALLAALLALLILMVILARERHTPGNPLSVTAGVLIGIASTALQVLVIYRPQTALGSPALSMGIGLAAVLGGSGLGALFFGHFATAKFWPQCSMSAATGVAVFVLFSPVLAEYCDTMNHTLAFITMGFFTVLTCLPIGLPFLAAIHSCKSISGHVEGLIIGCDGLGSILGATGATALAMTAGFSMVGWTIVIGFVGVSVFRPQHDQSPG